MITLTIDPGLRGVGAALFETRGQDSVLLKASYVPNKDFSNLMRACLYLADLVDRWVHDATKHHIGDLQQIVFEWPQVYTQSRLKGDPNDLLPLVSVNTAIACLANVNASLIALLPARWKGQVDKGVIESRVRERLSPQELSKVEAFGSKAHNVWDAVGIGLFHLGRLKPVKVYAR